MGASVASNLFGRVADRELRSCGSLPTLPTASAGVSMLRILCKAQSSNVILASSSSERHGGPKFKVERRNIAPNSFRWVSPRRIVALRFLRQDLGSLPIQRIAYRA